MFGYGSSVNKPFKVKCFYKTVLLGLVGCCEQFLAFLLSTRASTTTTTTDGNHSSTRIWNTWNAVLKKIIIIKCLWTITNLYFM